MVLKRVLIILLIGLLILGMTACAPTKIQIDNSTIEQQTQPGADSAQAAPGENNKTGVFPGTPDSDMVVIDATSEPVDLNPMMVIEIISQTILQHTMAGLARLDENDNPVEDVAQSWEISDDKMTYTIHLREDAKWSNGDPVTANDFYFSWMTQLDAKTASPGAPFFYDNIKNGKEFYDGTVDASQVGIKVIDDYTLQIDWSRPMNDGLFFLTLPAYLPLNQKAYEEIGADQYAKEADKMVTNGAYRLTEWVHDDHITLEKSEDYYDAARINIPKVKLMMINDDNTRLNAFMAGEMDMVNIYSNQIKQVDAQAEGAVQQYLDGGSWYFSFNVNDPYLSNANLRKALSYSVDIQSLLDNVIADGSVAADGIVPAGIGEADSDYTTARGSLFAYDPQAAKSYFEQALQELGVTAADLALKISVYDSSYSQNQAAYVQQQWKDALGLDVEIEVLPYKALSEIKTSGDFQIGIDGWGPSENDPITFLQVFETGYPNNYGQYSNAEFDALIDKIYQEADSAKRQELMIQAEKILIEDMAVGPMYFTSTSYIISEKLEGLVRTPFQMFSLTNGAKIVQ